MSTGEVSRYECDNNVNQTKKVDGVEGIAGKWEMLLQLIP